ANRGIAHAVDIVGRVPFERIGEYLRSATVGWVTWQPVAKNQKNIPTKLFEYMAFGLPVVSSDLLSTRQFVEPGMNGLLVAAADPAEHAAALLAILSDERMAAEMGRVGQQQVAGRFNWRAMEPRLLALYEALLSGSRGFDV